MRHGPERAREGREFASRPGERRELGRGERERKERRAGWAGPERGLLGQEGRGKVWRNHPKLLGPGALIFVAKQL